MDNAEPENSNRKKISALDFFVILLCLFGIAASLYLFQDDLFRTFGASSEPAGFVVVRNNSVQRRLEGRNVWDHLFEKSRVYYGDLIHIARLSSATLNINDNNIVLGEYTVIYIRKDTDAPFIDVRSGDISIASGRNGGGMSLSFDGRIVEVASGTVLSASYRDEGLLINVSEGVARIIQDDKALDIPAGTIIVQDAAGNEIREPTPAVIEADIVETEPLSDISFEDELLNELIAFLSSPPPPEPPIEVSFPVSVPASSIPAPSTAPAVVPPVTPPSPASAPVTASAPSTSAASVPAAVTPAPQPSPLLAPPANRQPASGYRITAETLRQQRNISFSWSAVQDANAYILTIYRDSSSGRRQVFQIDLDNILTYTLDDLRLLVSNGTFYWQVEAIYRGDNGRIERRGRPGENSFALDVRRPERVQTSDSGVLYGN